MWQLGRRPQPFERDAAGAMALFKEVLADEAGLPASLEQGKHTMRTLTSSTVTAA